MRRTFMGLALGAGLLLLVPPARASGQSLASIAAASATTTVAAEKTGAGCWGCTTLDGVAICQGGNVPGYWNCSSVLYSTCYLSSPGCGASAALPLDPDGSAQYVSRGSRLGIPVEAAPGGPPVRRNCEGVVVARKQTPDDIAGVRIRTGSLSL